MGLRAGSWVTLWGEPQQRGSHMVSAKVTASRKNKNGEYETDFQGFLTFFGEAAEKVMGLQPKDRFMIDDLEVTRKYDKEKQKEYINLNVRKIYLNGEVPENYISNNGGNGQNNNNRGFSNNGNNSSNYSQAPAQPKMENEDLDLSNDELPF